MIDLKVKVDDEVKEFTLPESWDDVNIGDFCNLFAFERQGLNEIELVVESIHQLIGIERDLIYNMEMKDFQTIAAKLNFLTTEMKPKEVVDYVELDGEKYYIKKDFNSLTMGEVISIETIFSEADNNLFKVMDKLLCVFLRKKKDNGKLENFKGEFMQRQELFRKAPVTSVYNVFNFFLNGELILSGSTKASSVSKKSHQRRKKE